MSFFGSPMAKRIARRAEELMRANPGHSRDEITRTILKEDGTSWSERGHDYQSVVSAVMLGEWPDSDKTEMPTPLNPGLPA